MAKGRAKDNSKDSLAPPLPRSLRLRKREYPSDEIYETGDVQASLSHQDTLRNNKAVDVTWLQESSMISAQHQKEKQPCLPKHNPATGEKHAETNISLKNVTAEGIEGQEDANNDTWLDGFRVHADNDANKSRKNKEEVTTEKSLSQICTDPPQVLLPFSEEGDGSTTLEEQPGSNGNSPCNLDRNQENSHVKCSNVCTADVKEVERAAPGLPANKKQRMGMLGLSLKKQSPFQQTHKLENRQNRPEKNKQFICNNTADHSLSTPAGSDAEQNEPEIKLQPSHCGVTDRMETEVHIAVNTSAETTTVYNPGCSNGKSKAAGGILPGPEKASDTKSIQEDLWENQKQQELEKFTGSMADKPQELIKNEEDKSAVVTKRPSISFYSIQTQNEETADQDAETEAVNSVTKTKDEKNQELTVDAGGGDGADTDALSEGFNFGSVSHCEAAVSPSGSQRKDSGDPDDKPGTGPSSFNAVHPETRDATEPFESGYLDYVSDSQLNTISLTEVEVMEAEEALSSPDCHDATDLICGLIRELSSLNRKVMASHKELENLRRSSKSSRSSTC